MGTTAEKLAYLNGTKTAIKNAIVAKGVAVPDGTTFRGYAEKIGEIVATMNAEIFQVQLTASDWSLGSSGVYRKFVSSSNFVSSGYLYVVFAGSDFDLADAQDIIALNIYATYGSGNRAIFYCSTPPEETISISIARIPCDGDSDFVNTLYGSRSNLVTNYENTVLFSKIISKYVPIGKAVGDVNRDGVISDEDAELISKAASQQNTLDDEQKTLADVDGNGRISSVDASTVLQVVRGFIKLGSLPAARDITDTWTVNPNFASEAGQFYLDVVDSEATSSADFVVVFEGADAKKVTSVVPSDGSFRVYMTVPPITPMPYKIINA